jgi:hypothetical protein
MMVRKHPIVAFQQCVFPSHVKWGLAFVQVESTLVQALLVLVVQLLKGRDDAPPYSTARGAPSLF